MSHEKLITAVSNAYPHASEILVSFPDEWELVETIQQRRRERTNPLYIAAMPLEPERPTRDHFAGLSPEINLSLNSYRLYRFFQPWPMPTILVDWNAYLRQGRVVGNKDLKVQLQDLGDAQTWTGPEVGVLWECFMHSRGEETKAWQETLAEIWQIVEKSMGVTKVFTPDHEPTMEPEAYRQFLERLGYSPYAASPRWWSKNLT
jgi:hypothetical protein